MNDEEKMLQALEVLAYGGEEVKEVIQYERVANGRDAIRGKSVTTTKKLPDKGALFKLMEIKGVYVEPKTQQAKNKLNEEEGERKLERFVKEVQL